MAQYRSLRDTDWVMATLAVVLSLVGVAQIASATAGSAWASAWWKQLVWISLGFGAMLMASRVDYHRWLEHAWTFYLLSLAGLAGVLVFGAEAFGSRRWLVLPGGVRLQVSEFAKLAIIVVVARYFSELRTERAQGSDLARIAAITIAPALLVAKQPDLGTALTYGSIAAAALFVARLPARYWIAMAAAGLLVLPLGWNLLEDYQKARIYAFLDPSRDPRGSGYQVIQSKIAVGSGGLWGTRSAQGTQAQLRFLPVPHTDFIFAAYAEEHGFVGVTFALSLYVMLLLQIFRNAQRAADRAGLYLCVGVGALLLFHVFVNLAMVVGRMPVTGLPLPLMSYGGSSALSVFLMLGLVNNVRLHSLVN